MMATLPAAEPYAPEGLTTRNLLLVSLCSLAYLFDGFTSAIIGPLAPGMAKSLALTQVELGPLFSANAAGSGVGLLLISLMPRWFPEKNVLITAILAFGVLTAITGLANSRDLLIALRFLTNIGLGGALPICLAMVARAVAARRHGVAVTILITAFGMGAFFAGVVASWFQGVDQWRSCLFITGALCAASGLLCWLWLAPPNAGTLVARDGKPHSPPGAGRSPFALFSPGMVLGTLMLWLAFIGVLTTQTIITTWLPTLLVALGRDAAFASLVMSAFMGGGVVAGPLIGVMIDRWGAARVLVGFILVSIVSLWWVGSRLATLGETELVLAVGVAGFFMLGAYTGVNVILASFYPEDIRTVGIGWAKFAARVGTLAAPIAVGIALQSGVSQQEVVIVSGVTLTVPLTAVLVLAWVMRMRRDARQLPS